MHTIRNKQIILDFNDRCISPMKEYNYLYYVILKSCFDTILMHIDDINSKPQNDEEFMFILQM